ncbi:hypothetical protein GGR52DRAFT_45529 [Hypoxylon sp. FL1284]|nr:hypothetical protein GGR52DRAFT_45529 [Hypoxylon sp. FL1284]
MYEYRIKTSPSGRQQFVRSQSFTHHHDHDYDHHRYHYRTRCFENCAGISLEQWNTLRGQNKSLMSDNETLTRENQALKTDLQTTSQENGRLVAYNQQMMEEIEGLRRSRSHDSDNSERFRRRVAALKTEVESKNKSIHHLEKENNTLAKRVGVLTQTVSDHAKRISDATADLIKLEGWYDNLKSKYEKVRRVLASQTRELDEKNILIEDQRRMIRRLETSLPPTRRRYSFA